MAKSAHKNQLAPGISRLSRSAVFSKRAAYKLPKRAPAAAATTETAPATTEYKPYIKNDLIDAVAPQPTKLTNAVVTKPKAVNKAQRAPKLRASITPGTVLILLAGRFRGRRVVFLKQLSSGMLLVTGPYKFNGVPLRRVNQAYVIATSTKVDISGTTVDITDKYFKRESQPKLKGTEAEFFGEQAQKQEHPAQKIADQKKVDQAIVAAVAKVPFLASYLASSFSLSKGEAPHKLKF
ncbi:60S ribosomal protein L6 [Coemansia sp. RSA 1290]|nr:ribosomal protein L6e-domain-containing protein [Coemansia mojavensis]KAJ2631558.1 60S ribosomal protein L6 [Coemansia sp. RSA 1290]KAJ2646478.1 60S ribosomal protein L6 [Coemansia sp. RSA 1250]KAJ2668251.1 60S ribosomal protein L6 [Coemansia sp. RSA 1085]